MSTFTCPVCHTPCPTLRDLLLCCPRDLRTMTTNLQRIGGGTPTIKDLTSGHVSAAMREALLFAREGVAS